MNEPDEDCDSLDQVAEEFLGRLRRGERPLVHEYAARHPGRTAELQHLLSALLMVEELKPNPDETIQSLNGAAATAPPFERLGDYRILRELGRGGMGVVYEAEQESLGRRVALKVLTGRSIVRPEQVERFVREARSAAKLHHTNIVPVFGVGEHEGHFYYAMQFIQGPGLDAVLDEVNRLDRPTRDDRTRLGELSTWIIPTHGNAAAAARSLVERPVAASAPADGATLFPAALPSPSRAAVALSSTTDSSRRYSRSVARIGVQVAEALEYAHRQGVLHRDVKPSNILFDAQGTAWVTDFGLAKSAEDDNLTQTGDLVGTIRYMAPERFRGQCDARSDVYGLGLTLYELLARRPAFDATARDRLIYEVTQGSPPSLRQLDRNPPRDLETIIQKAIERAPAHRYASAGAMAEDLRRFLEDRPIAARRTTAPERLVRWGRRNPGLALSTITVAVLLATIAVGSTIAAIHLSRQNARMAVISRETQEKLWLSYLAQAKASRESERAGRRFDGLAYVSRAARLDVFPERRTELRDEAIACLALADLHAVPRRTAASLNGRDPFAFDPDRGRYVHIDADGQIIVRNNTDDSIIANLPRSPLRPVNLWLSPSGRHLAVKSEAGGRIGLTVWDLERREPIIAVPEGVAHGAACFSPDGRWLAAGRRDGTIDLHDLNQPRAVRRLPPGPVPHLLRFSPDGTMLASSSYVDASVDVRDVESGETLASFDAPAGVYGLAWHPAGRTLAAGTANGQILLLNRARPNSPPRILEGHHAAVVSLAFHPDGDLVASASWDGTLRLWDYRTGSELLREALPAAGDLRFSGDGGILSPGRDGADFWHWRVSSGPECRSLVDLDSPVHATWGIEFRPEWGLLMTFGSDGLRFDAPEANKQFPVSAVPGTASAVISPDGSFLVTSGESGLQRWPIRSEDDGLSIGPAEAVGLPAGMPTGRVCLAPDGRTLAVVLNWMRGTGVILDLKRPDWRAEIASHAGLERLAFSPDARWLATGTWKGTGVRIWDARSGHLETVLDVDGSADATFSPDGRWLVTASGSEYRIWQVGSWKPGLRANRQGAGDLPGKAAFSPDGRRLAIARTRSLVQILDPATFEILASLEPADPRNVASIAFSADSSQLAVTENSRTVRLWDLHELQRALAPLGLNWEPATAPPSKTANVPRSVQLNVPAWLELARQGERHAEAGHWRESATAYDAAAADGDRRPREWHRKALSSLAVGRIDDYRAACSDMLDHFGSDVSGRLANSLAWTCVLHSEGMSDPDRIVLLARRGVEGGRDHVGLNTLGTALYRAGRFKEARDVLEQGIVAHGSGGVAQDWLLMTMTCARLGDVSEAAEWRERLTASGRDGTVTAADCWERLEIQLLTAEADRVLETVSKTAISGTRMPVEAVHP